MPTLVCPTCKRRVRYQEPADVPHRPFCCQRCQWVDLARWLGQEYRLSSPLESWSAQMSELPAQRSHGGG
ncbi:MAG: DNA gyrase inhibitor YacG [Phycisphaerae bacterium]